MWDVGITCHMCEGDVGDPIPDAGCNGFGFASFSRAAWVFYVRIVDIKISALKDVMRTGNHV